MSRSSRLSILKFGGSVLRSEDDLPACVHEVYRHHRQGEQVVVVVSALLGVTDALLARSTRVSRNASSRALAALLVTGEARAQAFMVLALEEAGISAVSLSPQEVGLRAEGPDLDAQPMSVDRRQLKSHLDAGAVVVLPGFVGRSEEGHSVLLGRGGSDLTALFLADALKADRCLLFKDTGSLFEADPNKDPGARRLVDVSFESAGRLGGDVLQAKALEFAKACNRSFEVTGVGSPYSTQVGAWSDVLQGSASELDDPISVQLLGCGTVGGAVLDRLLRLPSRFRVTGILVRDPDRQLLRGLPAELLTQNPSDLIETPAGIVVEAMGGLEPADELISLFLQRGASVVTANKFLMATHGTRLKRLAGLSGTRLLWSAAVGGSTPALEVIRRQSDEQGVQSLRGVLNGTCNYILDELHAGVALKHAVDAAQVAGFAEADPTMDLSGRDTAQKLILLVQEAWGVSLGEDDVPTVGIDSLEPTDIEEAASRGLRYRLIAEAVRLNNGVRAKVRPVALAVSDPLAHTTGARNILQVETHDASVVTVIGSGAGASPTAESILGDLIQLETEARCLTVARREIRT